MYSILASGHITDIRIMDLMKNDSDHRPPWLGGNYHKHPYKLPLYKVLLEDLSTLSLS